MSGLSELLLNVHFLYQTVYFTMNNPYLVTKLLLALIQPAEIVFPMTDLAIHAAHSGVEFLARSGKFAHFLGKCSEGGKISIFRFESFLLFFPDRCFTVRM